MSDERRIRLSPDERRAQLVAVGVNYLADHPLDDLTMDELARRAGVSRPLLFHYFETRQGMHRAVVTTARDSLLSATEPRADLAPGARIRDTLTRIVAFVRGHRGTFFSLVRGVASGDPEVRTIVDESRDLNALRLREAFQELGAVDSPVLRLALRAWVSFAEEVLIEWVVDADVADELVVSFLVRSLRGVVSSADGSATPAI